MINSRHHLQFFLGILTKLQYFTCFQDSAPWSSMLGLSMWAVPHSQLKTCCLALRSWIARHVATCSVFSHLKDSQQLPTKLHDRFQIERVHALDPWLWVLWQMYMSLKPHIEKYQWNNMVHHSFRRPKSCNEVKGEQHQRCVVQIAASRYDPHIHIFNPMCIAACSIWCLLNQTFARTEPRHISAWAVIPRILVTFQITRPGSRSQNELVLAAKRRPARNPPLTTVGLCDLLGNPTFPLSRARPEQPGTWQPWGHVRTSINKQLSWRCWCMLMIADASGRKCVIWK